MELINTQEHLTEQGLGKIINIKASINKGGVTAELEVSFPEINPVKRPLVKIPDIIPEQ